MAGINYGEPKVRVSFPFPRVWCAIFRVLLYLTACIFASVRNLFSVTAVIVSTGRVGSEKNLL